MRSGDGRLRERALRLLARREYTRQELSRKIAPLAESAEQLAALLDDLTTRHLLSDERYAEARRNSRAPRLGDARLAYELRSRGVAAELVCAYPGRRRRRVDARAAGLAAALWQPIPADASSALGKCASWPAEDFRVRPFGAC
jgi:SOS response regulatory protein OraA/RecX